MLTFESNAVMCLSYNMDCTCFRGYRNMEHFVQFNSTENCEHEIKGDESGTLISIYSAAMTDHYESNRLYKFQHRHAIPNLIKLKQLNQR
jgi:hypothetical protein